VPVLSSFDYAVIRVVPRVDREEFINAGVIVFCPEQQFLAARIHMDEARLKALWPDIDVNLVQRHLQAFPDICAGDPNAGPISRLNQRERFHWLVSPRSTTIQVSPVHSGLCDDPHAVVERLCRQLVESDHLV
jgi:hypothetical protein